ncbi:MAG: DNA-directed RNA polymerase subunit alpha [Helicobacteraceae bacterium]
MEKIRISPCIPDNFEINKNGFKASIAIYPFEAGYAITLAHPVKRLILSSTVGYAPTALKIEGVTHEFDSIRGVIEDVASLIINLKNIRFKLKDETVNKKIVSYKFTGYKEVKGADFNNDDVEVSSADMHFATINEDGELDLTLVIEKGMGYVPSEEIRESVEAGFLPLDAIFTPVKRANYSIEKVLVEDNPNFEKIIFNIETDGQIGPEVVFQNAVSTMFKQLEIFKNEFNIRTEAPSKKVKQENTKLKTLCMRIEELNFSARSHNCLTRSDIRYVGEVAMMSESEISKIKNLGKRSLDEIKQKLEDVGFPINAGLSDDLKDEFKTKLKELKAK